MRTISFRNYEQNLIISLYFNMNIEPLINRFIRESYLTTEKTANGNRVGNFNNFLSEFSLI